MKERLDHRHLADRAESLWDEQREVRAGGAGLDQGVEQPCRHEECGIFLDNLLPKFRWKARMSPRPFRGPQRGLLL